MHNDDGFIVFIMWLASLFTVFVFTLTMVNMPIEKYQQAEQACVSLGSHVAEFDRTGEAICQNKASIDYKEFMKDKGK